MLVKRSVQDDGSLNRDFSAKASITPAITEVRMPQAKNEAKLLLRSTWKTTIETPARGDVPLLGKGIIGA